MIQMTHAFFQSGSNTLCNHVGRCRCATALYDSHHGWLVIVSSTGLAAAFEPQYFSELLLYGSVRSAIMALKLEMPEDQLIATNVRVRHGHVQIYGLSNDMTTVSVAELRYLVAQFATDEFTTSLQREQKRWLDLAPVLRTT